MPRKPNYKFERFERDRAKAEKKAARLQAKADRRGQKSAEDGTVEGNADEAVEISVTPTDTDPGTD